MAAGDPMHRVRVLALRLVATRRRCDAWAFVAGAATVLAFAPLGWWPFAVIGPAALFLLWHECTRARAAWRGWLYGLGDLVGGGVGGAL
ncbi:MAG: hypothetical protein BRD57_06285, partial [Proteobacteria bacterium SW_6_67_9]